MKRKQFIALLCVVTMSVCLVTPVMAEENQATEVAQETIVDQEMPTEEVTKDEKESDVENATAVEETVPVEEVKDGFVEEDGKVYYYEDGTLVINKIVEFTEEDGTTYACFFLGDGSMMIDDIAWCEFTDENGNTYGGNIRADKNGHLVKGWYQRNYGNASFEYYNSDYFQVYNEIIEENGNKYYLNNEGILITNSQIVFDGELYQADATGALTKCEVTTNLEWKIIGGEWYLFVDGKIIRNQYYVYQENTYYFDDAGIMQTGVFLDQEGEIRLAESSGIVFVNPTKDWNVSKDGKSWYFFKEENGRLCPAYSEVITGPSGKKYYFGFDGSMWLGYFTETFDDGRVIHYMTNDSGEIQETNDWVKYDGDWYFWRDGDILKNGVYDIWGKKYYFDYDGVMQLGRIDIYENDNQKLYLTDSSGAIISSPGWNWYKNHWYYMNEDGSVRTNEFVEDGNQLYYVDGYGEMATRDFNFNGKDYHADSNGVILRNSWYQNGYDWCYAGKDGAFLTDRWISGEGGVWYYLNEDGAMAKGTCWVYDSDDNEKGKYEYFDENGVWQQKNPINKNGWSLVDGTWYYYKDGNPYTGWLGSYYIDNGIMYTNTYVYDDYDEEKTYYVDYKGVYQTNSWVTIPGMGYSWRYVGPDGAVMHDQWIGNYYVDEHGDMVANTIVNTGDYGLCKFAEDGKWIGYAKKADWNAIGNKWYYVDDMGTLVKNCKRVIGGKTYYFRYDGVMRANTAFYDHEGELYVYVGSDGAVSKANGWELGEYGEWYYLENGTPKTGWFEYKGKKYYLSPRTYTGSVDVWDFETNEKEDYFFDQDGAVIKPKDGWFSMKVNGQTCWYYIKNGEAVTGTWYNGCYFNWNGQMSTGPLWTSSDDIYVFDDNGCLLKNGWHELDGVWYYTDAKGRAYTGERKINGTTYWFTNSGVWVK